VNRGIVDGANLGGTAACIPTRALAKGLGWDHKRGTAPAVLRADDEDPSGHTYPAVGALAWRPITVTASRPLVSVVTPTRNQAEFIEDTLRSLERQTYPNIEHVVVDGGSTDGTLAILGRWHGRHPLRWISEPDKGMYDAVNKGLRLAEGDILAYLNSDDLLLPWAVERAVAAFEDDAAAAVVFGDALRVDDVTGAVAVDLHPSFSPAWTPRFGTIVQPAVFWRRSTYQRFGEFDADLRYIADLDYWLRVGRQAPVAHVQEVLAVVRWHERSLTVSQRRPMRVEEAAMRARHHGDGSIVRPVAKGAGRVLHGLRQRAVWLRFAAAVRGGSSSAGWPLFRQEMKPRIASSRFGFSFVPLVGRLWGRDWLTVEWPSGVRPRLAGDRGSQGHD
jgi:glycosyltransferase involved in cell wall biosynthesis